MTLHSQPSPAAAPPESSSAAAAASTSLTALSLTPILDDGDDDSIGPVMPPPKPTPRARVPLEKGYSQMVWLRLLQTEPDLAGLKGKSPKRLITMEEVKQHKMDEDAWTVLRGRVYNISPYIRFHPGGKDMLMKGAGRDCTALFSIFILHVANWCSRNRLNVLFLLSLFGSSFCKVIIPSRSSFIVLFKILHFCFGNARLDLTTSCQTSIMHG